MSKKSKKEPESEELADLGNLDGSPTEAEELGDVLPIETAEGTLRALELASEGETAEAVHGDDPRDLRRLYGF